MAFKIVKSAKAMASLADKWFTLRAERLAADKVAAGIKEQENAAKAALIASLKQSKTGAIGGSKVTASFVSKDKPMVSDWDALYSHIQKTGEFDLLHKRLGEKAIALRWEDEVDIPGVEAYPVDDISYSAVK